ncbi:MAG: hypothetical protein WDO74_33115 [Pseudomonadota bacterium]
MKLVPLLGPTAPDSTLIYDWNGAGDPLPAPLTVTLLDETLRDGLQSPSVKNPSLAEKLAGLALMNELGIEYVNVGLPSASPRALSEAVELCRAIAARRYAIRPVCAGRTMASDVAAIAEVSQRAGMAIEASLFIGSSPIRAVAEDWDLEFLLSRSKSAIDAARHADLPVTFVTEDSTRARPETLRALFSLAVERGAARICLCDTVGFATPEGVAAVTRFFPRNRGRAHRNRLARAQRSRARRGQRAERRPRGGGSPTRDGAGRRRTRRQPGDGAFAAEFIALERAALARTGLGVLRAFRARAGYRRERQSTAGR